MSECVVNDSSSSSAAAAAAVITAAAEEDIPVEILQACFARLPPRCVARSVRGVCRRWRTLSDPDTLYRLRKTMGLTQPCIYTVSSSYQQGHYVGLQITSAESTTPKVDLPASNVYGQNQEYANFVVNPRPVTLLYGCPRLQFAAAAAAEGRLLYILGGRSPLISRRPDTWLVYRRVDAYDVVSNTWIQAQPMQETRYAFAAAAFRRPGDGRPQLVVAGGYDAHGRALASAELYDALSDRWHDLPSMNSLSGACKGEFTRGKFYVKMANNGPLALEAFDPTSLCWMSPFSMLSHQSKPYLPSPCEEDDEDPLSISAHKFLSYDTSPSALIFEL